MPVDAYQLDKPLIDDGNNRIRPIYSARNLALGGALGTHDGRIQLATGDAIRWDDGTSLSGQQFAPTGAVGDGVADDLIPLQAAIDAAIQVGGTVQLEAGAIYRITDSLLIARLVALQFQYAGCKIAGHKRTTNGLPAQASTIFIDSLDVPAIIIQGGYGVEIENVRIVGRNVIAGNFGTYDDLLDETNFYVAGLRTNHLSPQAGICIDPYDASVIGADQYPGHAARYGYDLYKSSAVTLRGCSIERCAYGVCVSSPGSAANADFMHAFDTTFYECMIAWHSFGTQTRGCVLRDCTITVALVGISNSAWPTKTAERGTPPNLDNVAFGLTKNLFNVTCDTQAMSVVGCYAETFLSIGFLAQSKARSFVGVSFYGCEFQIAQPLGFQIDAHLAAHGPVLFSGCTLGILNEVPIRIAVDALDSQCVVEFANCHFNSDTDSQFSCAPSRPELVLLRSVTHRSAEVPQPRFDDWLYVEVLPLGNSDLTAGIDGTFTFETLETVPDGSYVYIADVSVNQLTLASYGDPFTTPACIGISTGQIGTTVTVTGAPVSLVTGVGHAYDLELRAPTPTRSDQANAPSRLVTFADSPYTVGIRDKFLRVDTTGGIVVLYTWDPTTGKNRQLLVHDWKSNFAANKCTLDAATVGGTTINGVASIDLTADGDAALVHCDGLELRTIPTA